MIIKHPIVEIVVTGDGSPSLFVPELKEQYHSRFGAIAESMHIYIGLGFNAVKSNDISVFELGFGTGLNALLTFREARAAGVKVQYDSIELYPVTTDIAEKLDYSSWIKETEIYTELHHAEWGQDVRISPEFTLRKIQADFRSYIFNRKYDLFYFDAFAPQVQPELWTQERFDRIAEAMKPGGILVTYSAMGEIRRRLLAAGFEVKRLAGPPGKREILQAYKQ
jgi:tRNA U34 5-methylaminomethyl-2-thiouridine-forming methyltransferase MnmC